MTQQELKVKLLNTNYFIDNEYLNKYCELIELNKNTKKERPKTQSHHIIPVSYFKISKLPIDNSKENKVNLLYKNHILAHYYLCLCTNGKFKYCMENGFMHLTYCKWEYKNFNPKTDLDNFQRIYEDYILNKKQYKMSGKTKEALIIANSIPVQNLETGKIYKNSIEAVKEFGFSASNINISVNYTAKRINRKAYGYHWISLKDREPYTKEERKEILDNLPPMKKKGRALGSKMPEGTGAKIGAKLRGREYSEETIQRMSKSKEGKPVGEFSKSHIENMVQSRLGHKQSEETRKRKSEAMKGFKFTKHSVYCPELDKIYSNTKEAAAKLGLNSSSIQRCCVGRKYSINGYTFKYIPNIIYIYCPELNEYFEYLDDIVTKYGYNKSLISASITGRKEIVYGMHWVRVNMMEIGKFKLEDLIKESI